METGDLLRIVMIIIGVVLLFSTIMSLAKRQLKEQFCLMWGVISCLLIGSGIILRPSYWNRYVSQTGTIFILIAAVCLIWGVFFITSQISVLNRKNQELAMQVSLLNQENERILEELQRLEEKIEKE